MATPKPAPTAKGTAKPVTPSPNCLPTQDTNTDPLWDLMVHTINGSTPDLIIHTINGLGLI